MLLYAVVLLVTSSYSSQVQAKETFKASQFLEWNEGSQKLFIQAAVLMAGSIWSLNNKKKAKCIYDWYFSGNENSVRQSIVDVMRKYPDYPPTGVIIAVAQKQCGSFKFGSE